MAKDNEYDDFEEFDIGMDDGPKTLKDHLKDAVQSFKYELFGGKEQVIKTIKDMITESVPSGISEEMRAVKTTISEVKTELTKTSKEMLDLSASIAEQMKEFTSEDSKGRKILDKVTETIGPRESSNTSSSGTTSPLNSRDQDLEAIMNDLAFSKRSQGNVESAKMKIEAGRHQQVMNVSSELLSHAGFISNYHQKVTTNYYRRSLEANFKSLWIASENAQNTKAGFDNIVARLDELIKTSMWPENKKITAATKPEELENKMFGKFDPLENVRKSIVSTVQSKSQDIIAGLTGADSVLSQLNMASAMTGGSIPIGAMIGGYGADLLKSYVGGKIGDKISKSKKGSELIYAIKNAATDPYKTFQDLARGTEDDESRWGKVKNRAFSALANLTYTGKHENRTGFKIADPNAPAIFDNRVRTSITTVIPTLIGKTNAILEAIRTKTNPSDHVTTFDFKTNTFKTSKEIKEDFTKTVEGKMKNIRYDLNSLLSMIEENADVKFTDKDRDLLRKGILRYIVSTKNVTPSRLLDKRSNIVDYVQASYKQVVAKAVVKMLERAKKESWYLNMISSALKNTLTGIPSMTDVIKEHIDNGHANVLMEMGVLKQDDDEYSVSNKKLLRKGMRGLDTADYSIKTEEVSPLQADIRDLKDAFIDAVREQTPSKEDIKETLKQAHEDIKNEGLKNYTNRRFTQFKHYAKENTNEFRSNAEKEIDELKTTAEDKLNELKTKASDVYNKSGMKPHVDRGKVFIVDQAGKVIDVIDKKIEADPRLSSAKQKIKEAAAKLKEATPDVEDVLRTKYFTSEEKLSGALGSFEEYLASYRLKIKDISDDKNIVTGIKAKMESKVEEQKKKAIDKGKEIYSYYRLKVATDEELDALRTEFFNSPEFQTGAVDSEKFEQWINTKGRRTKKIPTIAQILSRTRAFDKWLAGKIMKGAWGGVKLGASALGMAGKASLWGAGKMGRLGMYAADGLLSVPAAGVRGVYNKVVPESIRKYSTPFFHKIGLNGNGFMGVESGGVLNTTRSLDAEAPGVVKDTITKVAPHVIKTAGKTLGLGMSGLKGAAIFGKKLFSKGDEGWGTNVKDIGAPGKIKDVESAMVNGHIKDLDQEENLRKNDWRTRLKKFTQSKDAKSIKAEVKQDKDKSGIYKLLASSIIPILTGVWTGIKKLMDLPKILMGIGSLISKIPGVGMLGSAATAIGGGIAKVGGKVLGAIKKITPQMVTGKAEMIKTAISKKLGPVAGAKLLGKVASVLVPGAGWALAAYTAGMATKYMVSDGLSIQSAISKALIGFDIFGNDTPVDEDGKAIKPDDSSSSKPQSSNINSNDNANKTNQSSGASKLMDQFKTKLGDGWNSASNAVSAAYTSVKDTVVSAKDTVVSAAKTAGEAVMTGIDTVRGKGSRNPQVQQAIQYVAKQTGLPEGLVSKIAEVESSYDPSNKTGSYVGLFQMGPESTAHAGMKYDVEMLKDPMYNAQAFASYFNKVKPQLEKNNIPITATTLYLLHQQGSQGLPDIWNLATKGKINGTRNYNLSKHLSANPPFKNSTGYYSANEFLQGWAKKFGEKLPIPDNGETITPDIWKRLASGSGSVAVTGGNNAGTPVKIATAPSSVSTPPPPPSTAPSTTTTAPIKQEVPIKKSDVPSGMTNVPNKNSSDTSLAKYANYTPTNQGINAADTSINIGEQLNTTNDLLAKQLKVQIRILEAIEKGTGDYKTSEYKPTEKAVKPEVDRPDNRELPPSTIDIKRKEYRI